jgi:hypothetical protein
MAAARGLWGCTTRLVPAANKGGYLGPRSGMGARSAGVCLITLRGGAADDGGVDSSFFEGGFVCCYWRFR